LDEDAIKRAQARAFDMTMPMRRQDPTGGTQDPTMFPQ
jgi:hypothetical protein